MAVRIAYLAYVYEQSNVLLISKSPSSLPLHTKTQRFTAHHLIGQATIVRSRFFRHELQKFFFSIGSVDSRSRVREATQHFGVHVLRLDQSAIPQIQG